MIKLFTDPDFEAALYKDTLPLQCTLCNNIFHQTKKYIRRAVNNNGKGHNAKFCSLQCSNTYTSINAKTNPKRNIICTNCLTTFSRKPSQSKRSINNFCSKSCAASYNNKHKTYGTRRSKLEIYLEQELTKLYPNLEFHFNRKDTINSELDIYIPSLKLAFELNSIFHYEPIYGIDKLSKIQNNDNRKFQACLEQNIELCIIDSSSLKYFKERNIKKFLDIISTIISKNL